MTDIPHVSNISVRRMVVSAILCAISSCSWLDNGESMSEWRYGKLDEASLKETDASTQHEYLLTQIEANYKANPKDRSYDKLELFSVFEDGSTKRTLLIFDVRYVDDTQVVYEVDREGRILDKYLLSPWGE